jgi:hypothetical protein
VAGARRRQALHGPDVEELEGHLRDQLVLYAASARDPQVPPDFFDGLQLLLVVSALVVDGVALGAIAARISEFGFTSNRVAALG